MKAKFNKDLLLKHKFWVLLAVSVPLIIVAFFILSASVGAEIEAAKKKNSDKFTQVSKPGTVIGPKVIVKGEALTDQRKKDEVLVHADAFKAQDVLFTWPQKIEERFDFQ